MNIYTTHERAQFLAEMNSKWQRKYKNYQKWLKEEDDPLQMYGSGSTFHR